MSQEALLCLRTWTLITCMKKTANSESICVCMCLFCFCAFCKTDQSKRVGVVLKSSLKDKRPESKRKETGGYSAGERGKNKGM